MSCGLAHRDQPVAAIIELVWNSLDAEAHQVNVVIERDMMDAVQTVRVEADGQGRIRRLCARQLDLMDDGRPRHHRRATPNHSVRTCVGPDQLRPDRDSDRR